MDAAAPCVAVGGAEAAAVPVEGDDESPLCNAVHSSTIATADSPSRGVWDTTTTGVPGPASVLPLLSVAVGAAVAAGGRDAVETPVLSKSARRRSSVSSMRKCRSSKANESRWCVTQPLQRKQQVFERANQCPLAFNSIKRSINQSISGASNAYAFIGAPGSVACSNRCTDLRLAGSMAMTMARMDCSKSSPSSRAASTSSAARPCAHNDCHSKRNSVSKQAIPRHCAGKHGSDSHREPVSAHAPRGTR
jgi:hypothetical protein